MLKKSIPIVAMGSLSPLGGNTQDVWKSYESNKHCFEKQVFDKVGSVWVAPLTKKTSKEVEALKASDKKYKDLDKSVLLAMLSSEKAVKQTGWKNTEKIGVNIGSSRGATATLEKYITDFNKGKKLSPLASPTSTLGNIAFWVGHYIGSQGPAISHSITCSTALHSLLNGVAWLQAGLSERFIIGGSEASLTPFTLGQMKSLKVYANTFDDNYPCRALDFKKEQNTMVLGEGACSFAIENNNDNALAYIKGIGYSTESLMHGASISENAECMQKAMVMATKGFSKNEIDIIVTHTPGTIKGDQSEYNAIKKVFGKKTPSITTNKWKIGHTFASSGAFSLEMAVMMIQKKIFIGIPYTLQHQPKRFKNILVNAVGFGGNAVSVLLSDEN